MLSKNKSKDLEALTVEKAKSAVEALIPHFNKAILNSDDISLFMAIDNIGKIENITSCYILDKSGKMLIPSDANKWNTEKNTIIYNNATKNKTGFLQQTSKKETLLLSESLAENHTLFCMISIQKASENARYWKIKYYTIASFVAVFIIIVFYFLSRLLILMPFIRIKKSLEDKSYENTDTGDRNEITDIFDLQRDKIAKKIQILKDENESLSKIIEYLQHASVKDSLAFIILNSLNEIVYAYDNTKDILKDNFEKGSHLLEITKAHDLIQIVEEANENQEKEIKKFIRNCIITAFSISEKGKVVGTIIKVQNKVNQL
ncbi:hypothetical protein AGMMS50222_05040 [Endomicrobiia bacterium]|nr:hypothetical protein AGMMS49531_05830 [Endomicrobiia bacterium]GHT65394.1 hypothetical protein AGMMS49556_05160 [Endomicrobiia bacterium]GHT74957.1 hypothetical protein AGMMS50222_05040 [Endomicrobiia bacterium]